MSVQPYIVWHTEETVAQEYALGLGDAMNLPRRYVVHARGIREAALFVDELKREQGRLLPDSYMVNRLSSVQDGTVHELAEDDDPDLEADVAVLEELFGDPTEVRIDR